MPHKFLKLALVALICLPALAANKFVRKGGNDSTGDGSTGNPWLTIVKGVATIAAGDTLIIGDGTYAENSGGRLILNKNWGTLTTLQSESADPTKVIILGASGTLNTQIQSNNIYFLNLSFVTKADTDSSGAVRVQSGDNLTFDNCRFTNTPTSGALCPGMLISPSGSNVGSVFIKNSSFFMNGTGAANAIMITGGTTNQGSGGITISNCTFYSGGTAINMVNGTNLVVVNSTIQATNTLARAIAAITPTTVGARTVSLTNCTFISDLYGFQAGGTTASPITFYLTNYNGVSTNSEALLFGRDATYSASTAGTITGTFTNCAVTCINGHGVCIGADTTNVIGGGIISTGNYAFVLKECNNPTINRCIGYINATTTGGGCYYKGVTNPVAINSIFYGGTNASVYAFRRGPGDGGAKTSGGTFTNNILVAFGGPTLFNSDSTGDAGGGECNFNTYVMKFSTNLGTVITSTNISTISGLQSAWSTYSITTNDSHSFFTRFTPMHVNFHLQTIR